MLVIKKDSGFYHLQIKKPFLLSQYSVLSLSECEEHWQYHSTHYMIIYSLQEGKFWMGSMLIHF